MFEVYGVFLTVQQLLEAVESAKGEAAAAAAAAAATAEQRHQTLQSKIKQLQQELADARSELAASVRYACVDKYRSTVRLLSTDCVHAGL